MLWAVGTREWAWQRIVGTGLTGSKIGRCTKVGRNGIAAKNGGYYGGRTGGVDRCI